MRNLIENFKTENVFYKDFCNENHIFNIQEFQKLLRIMAKTLRHHALL